MRSLKRMLLAAALGALVQSMPVAAAEDAPRGMAFEVYIRLEHGMTEGELILRAGRPDHQSFDGLRDGLKTFYYYPTPANPHLTTVTLRAGRITNIDRVRQSPR